jgi:zinc transport system ATP-binding protein
MSNLLSVQNISKEYDKKIVFEDLTFNIGISETILLTGANGTGKSTLAKVLLGIETQSTGKINKIEKLCCSYVPQNFFINTSLPINVKTLLSLVNPKVTDNEIVQLLNLTNIVELSQVQLNILSRGQLQRVLIALSLVNKPDLIVLDEPLQGLDSNSIDLLYNLLDNVKNQTKTALFIISHHTLGFKDITDKVFYLNKQKLTIYPKCEYINLFDSCVWEG